MPLAENFYKNDLTAIREIYPSFWVNEIDDIAEGQLTFNEPRLQFGGVQFKFVDLFAGIGGFRCGLAPLGGECVFTSEWDKHSVKTYSTWFNDENIQDSDFRDIDYSSIPDHEILCAGFPCQPFSLAGVSKKNSLGHSHGFKDEKQGNLFFSILDAVHAKNPPILFFENVKNLKNHDKGKTWDVIHSSLSDAGYHVFHKVIDAQGWVPQHRERIFIVCFNKEVFGNDRESISFRFPNPPLLKISLPEILEKNPHPKYMLTDNLWKYLKEYKEKHQSAGNGFGFGLITNDQRNDATTRTLSARYHKDGSEILIQEPGWKNPRRLTPREASLLQGFNDDTALYFGHKTGFPQSVSDTQAYRQFGNAVVPTVISSIAQNILSVFAEMLFLDHLAETKSKPVSSTALSNLGVV